MKASWFFKKFCILLASLFLVATLTFVLMHTIPGDPFIQEQAIPEEIMKSLYSHYGLDQPWHIQYIKYLKGIVTGNLGPSFKYESRTVNQIIADGFPVSMLLGLEALTIALGVGITLGTIAATFRGKWPDGIAMIIAVIGISVPNFILATCLQYLFAMQFNILPVARWGSFSHTILPALSLATLPTAFIARLTRASMIEVLSQDFILTAKAKGLGTLQIMFHHVLKNSLLSVLTYLGPLFSAILTGSFVIEKIFGIPGLGGWFVMSITSRDYTVIMGITLFYSAILMGCVFLVDLIYYKLDPRITLYKQKL